MKNRAVYPEKIVLSFRVPTDLHARIREKAEKEQRSISQISAMLLEKALSADARSDAA